MKSIFTSLGITTILFANAQRVGIGTPDTAINAMLHIRSVDSAVLLLQNAATSGTNVKTALYFKTGNYYGGGIATIGTAGTHRLGFFTYGDPNSSGLLERLTISDGGFVGIGNTNPPERLSVNGNMSVTGNSITGGNYIVSGKLGVGIASPSERLSVAGNANISGNVTALGVTVGNSPNLTNGTLRLDSASGKMQYREGGAWKQFTKEYFASDNISQSGTERNTLVVHPTYEYIVPASGFYFVVLEAELQPLLQMNGCDVGYFDNAGQTSLFSKTRSLELLSAGSFKWVFVSNADCITGHTIPLATARTAVLYLQKDEVLATATKVDMTNPPADVQGWSSSSHFTLMRME